MEHNEIDTLKDLANYLRCDIEFLESAVSYEYYVKDAGVDFKDSISKIIVSKFNIAKKGKTGGFRTVYQCWSHFLSSSLKILNTNLNEIFIPNQFSHGFVKGKNIQTNASCHLGKKLLLSVDIKNYFESISKDRICKSLEKLGFKKHVAEWISNITTLNNHLPQGFATSPTLANIVTQELDNELSLLCGDLITYSRYADDLYFSTNLDEISLAEITSIIENYGFNLNSKKTKFMSRGKKQYVTGLTVFDVKYPRISKRRKKNIRLEIYYLSKFGYKRHIRKKLIKSGMNPKDPDFKSHVSVEADITRDKLYGWLHFINAIEPDFAKKYYPKLKKAKQ
ncbi:MAG: RNA-directed DNA polymerase [Flavobacterium sp.]|nr:MAG: RNA-directed DNA polymerase [Flavobacterium sp.]